MGQNPQSKKTYLLKGASRKIAFMALNCCKCPHEVKLYSENSSFVSHYTAVTKIEKLSSDKTAPFKILLEDKGLLQNHS